MNQTYPFEYKEIVKVLAPRKTRTFSANMAKLRSPFLCHEKYASPQNFKRNQKRLEQKNDSTQQDFQDNVNEAGSSNTIDSDKETANSLSTQNYPEKDFQRNSEKQCARVEHLKNFDVKNKTFKTNLNKRLDIAVSANEGEASAISDYFTDDSENKTNNFLETDTSMENISFSDPLKPLKSSTFIIQGDTKKYDTSYRKGSKTFVFEDFIETNSLYPARTLQLPVITVNEEALISESFEDKEIKVADRSECEEKTKIIEMELFKQIEIKDKVMSHLLELSQTSEFPGLRHSGSIQCESDNKGICKKTSRLGHDAKLQEEHCGVLKYIWSTIKYPFTPVSPATQIKFEGIIRKNPVKKAYMQLKNKKINSVKLEDYKPRRAGILYESQKKAKPRKNVYLFQNGEKSDIHNCE